MTARLQVSISDPYTVRPSGDCGLRTIRTLRTEILSALEAATTVEIDCAEVERIDLSFVQLIASASKTAARDVKQIRLANLSDAGKAAFTRAGLPCPVPTA